MAKMVTGRKKTIAEVKEEKLKKEIREEVEEELKEDKKKKKKMWNSVYEVSDSIMMVTSAAAGIIFSKYIPAFRSGDPIEFVIPEWIRLVISFGLAFGVVAATELKGDVIGKKKNFLKRLYGAFAGGLMWHTILGF